MFSIVFGLAALTVAMAFGLTLAALAQPAARCRRSSPIPLTRICSTERLRPTQPNAPVIVFVHGLGGNFQDWIEAKNCPNPSGRRLQVSPSSKGLGSNNDMYDYAYQAGFRTVFLSYERR